MMPYVVLFLLLFLCYETGAHPGVGIVMDQQGNIYFTDLKQVWKRSADGRLTVAVPDVHTHELALDKEGNLYGEHLWYNGERTDTWGHYVWCLKPDGQLVKIKEPQEGFLENYGFMRDSTGNMYWIERFTRSRFRMKTANGEISTIAEGKFSNIRWSYCTPGGTLYFIDLHKLYRLKRDGRFTLLAENLDDGRLSFGFSRQHNVYGIWADSNENIYVAVMPAKKVKRIDQNGKTEVIAYSMGQWSPTCGLFDKEGNMWLLEYGLNDQCRVRKIEAAMIHPLADQPSNSTWNYIYTAAKITGLLITVFIFRQIYNRFRKNRSVSVTKN